MTPRLKRAALVLTHGAAVALGFTLGIYTLPILTAPAAPSVAEVQDLQAASTRASTAR